MYLNTLVITQPQIPISLFTWKVHTSNSWLSLALYNLYGPFHYISYDQRSTMTGLFSPTHYQGNQRSHHMRPYIVPYSSPCGNYHHKQTSLTTDDQPSYHPKPMKVITQVDQDLNNLFQFLIYMRMAYRNQIPHPWSLTVDLDHKSNLQLVHQ